MTPNIIADELGVNPKSVRAFLRKRFPRPDYMKYKPWVITVTMEIAIRARFA